MPAEVIIANVYAKVNPVSLLQDAAAKRGVFHLAFIYFLNASITYDTDIAARHSSIFTGGK